MNELSYILFVILISTGLTVFISAFRQYDRILQFPFLITCDLLFFLGAQFYYILYHEQLCAKYYPYAFPLFLMICILFYISALVGYKIDTVKFRIPYALFEQNRMIIGLLILSLISLYGRIKLASLPEELTNATQWTGLPVRYLFFASVGSLCIPLGIMLYNEHKKRIILFILSIEVISTMMSVVLSGRRSPAAFLALMVLTGLWFAKRYKVPRGMIIIGGIAFFMFVMNVGNYRYIMKADGKDKWNRIRHEVFDINKTIVKFTKPSGKGASPCADALNGIVASAAVYESNRYDFGVVFWNSMIFRWVPGQLIGHQLKNAMMLDVPGPIQVAKEECGYKFGVGGCTPGYAELFASFGFLGIIFMYYVGKLARMVWEQALTGNLVAQIFHFALAPVYLRFGGGGLWSLISGLFFWVVFLFPILWWAKMPARLNK